MHSNRGGDVTDKKRPATWSDDRRATVGRERRISPVAGVPVFECEDVTGNYEGEQLLAARRARAEQNPAHRIALIETEQKEQAERLTRIELATVEIRGDQKATNASLTGIERTLERILNRDDREHAAKVDDQLDARKAKRQRITAIVGGLFSAGVLGAIVGWLLS